MTVRTSRENVTFTRSFLLSAVGKVQPAGTYTVETDEELLQGLSFLAYRRLATLILVPSQSGGAVVTERVSIDPLELEAAQKRDVSGEAPLEDLLADEVLQQAVHSAGLLPSEFKGELRDLAARMRRGQSG